MVKHTVLFKLAGEAQGNSKALNGAIIKRRLESLKAVIPEIVKIEVLVNHPDAATDNYDILLDSEFETFADLDRYSTHPRHLEVGRFIASVSTARAAVDYEF